MVIQKIGYDFSICKVADYSLVQFDQAFTFAAKTDEENSLVCLTSDVPKNTVERNDGWKALRIQGILDFSLIGILSAISEILAKNKIGIFAISTFNTDYILTKAEDFQKAIDLLSHAGYTIIDERQKVIS